MLEPTYKIHRADIDSLEGVTDSVLGTLYAIIKRDCFECPHAVYNEIVALRLAQTLHVSVADGALTATDDDEIAYASLKLITPRMQLPNLYPGQHQRAFERYRQQATALTLFDIFIGNRDRERNLKASVISRQQSIFSGFDHANALMGAQVEYEDSIPSLNSENLIVRFHPFYRLVNYSELEELAFRYMEYALTYPDMITDCCLFPDQFQNVTHEMQNSLAEALVNRCRLLPQIVEIHSNIITGAPWNSNIIS